jgi:high-affinity Fe2+/Pb2+ permease
MGTLAVVLAIIIAVYYYLNEPRDESHIASAIAAAAGSTVAFIIGLLLVMIFEPSSVSQSVDLGAEIPGLIAYVIGVGVVAAVVSYGLDNYDNY